MISIISTTANIENDFDKRKKQYLLGLSSIIKYYEIAPYIIETVKRSNYLSEHYYDPNVYSINKGINEFINIKNFLITCKDRFNDNDDIIKTTLRYKVISSYFIDTIKKGTHDIYCKQSTDIYGEKDNGVHTFLISMKYKQWIKFLSSMDITMQDTPIEWQVAMFVKDNNTKYLDRLDIVATPTNLGKSYNV